MEHQIEVKIDLEKIINEQHTFASECDDHAVHLDFDDEEIKAHCDTLYHMGKNFGNEVVANAIANVQTQAITAAQHRGATVISYELHQIKGILADIAESLRVLSNRKQS